MNNPHANDRFRYIKTSAKMPDGRIIHSFTSYPNGAGKDVYDEIDANLVRAFGNDGSRTIGILMEENRTDDGEMPQSPHQETMAAFRDSKETRQFFRPLPCVACGVELDQVADDPHFKHIPYKGTIFYTSGHYGSTMFDSFAGSRIDVVVCDECLDRHVGKRIAHTTGNGKRTMWDGRSD